MLKRLLCNHTYHLLTSYTVDSDKGVGYNKVDKFIVYCPRCGKKKHLSKQNYETMINQQRVDKEYTDGLERDNRGQ